MKGLKLVFRRKTAGMVLGYALALLLVWACEEEEIPVARDPSVSIFYLNKDSLDKVNIIVDSLTAELVGFDTVIANLQTNANTLADSLITLTDSIAKGGDLESERDQVINDLDTLNNYLTDKEKEDSTVNVRHSEWTGVAETINSGSVKIASIENLKNGKSVSYQDSSTSWNLPLDMNADDIDLNITIADNVYRLVLNYERMTTADEKNKVLIRTSNFSVVQTDFNNPTVSCTDCQDIETTIHVEF